MRHDLDEFHAIFHAVPRSRAHKFSDYKLQRTRSRDDLKLISPPSAGPLTRVNLVCRRQRSVRLVNIIRSRLSIRGGEPRRLGGIIPMSEHTGWGLPKLR